MFQVSFISLLVIGVCCSSAYCQLPTRPGPGQVEEPVAAEFSKKLDDIVEQYLANFSRMKRFVALATLDRTLKRKDQPLHTDLLWFIHAQDFEHRIRRLDELSSALMSLPSGTQRLGVSVFSTIETEEDVFQFHTHNSQRSASRDTKKNEEDFGRSFRAQTRMNFLELPFSGSVTVLMQPAYPSLVWRELPKAPSALQEVGSVTAWHEDLTQVLARVSRADGLALDMTFSKALGNMPIRAVASENLQHRHGVSAIFETEWLVHRDEEFPEPIYLPTRVHCSFFSVLDTAEKDVHELEIRWLIGKDVSDFIFSRDSELYLTPVELKVLVQSKAINAN